MERTTKIPSHTDQIPALNRIEGQIRGIKKMIEEGKYCMDVLNLIGAVRSALVTVEKNIAKTFLENCVVHAFESGEKLDKFKKIDEIVQLLDRSRAR